MNWLHSIEFPGVTGTIEILILATVFYFLVKFFRGTRGAAILTGLVILFTFLIVITKFTNLLILNWLLQKLMVYLALALVVIFQPEIRRALARLGRQGNFLAGKARRALADPIADAVLLLASRKIGALIAIEREVETRGIQDTGTRMGSEVSAELLVSLFYPGTPLHDGGVIISEDRIAAAGCVFPLTQNDDLSHDLGTRHRAAIGLTEETDTVVLVVSEETGIISIAYNGRLKRGFDGPHLRRVLASFLGRESSGLRQMARRRNKDDDSGQLNFIFGDGANE
ncbi:MAG: diadenylate cyclase CdaA [Kiritimatiellales bacterium]|nr:diadenylate cyclase CdaA [Kiritimatiellales bacterium]